VLTSLSFAESGAFFLWRGRPSLYTRRTMRRTRDSCRRPHESVTPRLPSTGRLPPKDCLRNHSDDRFAKRNRTLRASYVHDSGPPRRIAALPLPDERTPITRACADADADAVGGCVSACRARGRSYPRPLADQPRRGCGSRADCSCLLPGGILPHRVDSCSSREMLPAWFAGCARCPRRSRVTSRTLPTPSRARRLVSAAPRGAFPIRNAHCSLPLDD
jgi:hypothetical protein